jgi:S-formylglutathione hydrolase FrmB
VTSGALSRPQRQRHPYRRRRVVALLVLLIVVLVVVVVVVHEVVDVDTHGARVVHFTVDSRLVHRTLTETAVIPQGGSGAGRPLLVFLHGKGENEDSNLDGPMFAALAALGSRAPDVVFPDGDEDSYWHDRESGAWGRYVIDEVIPRGVSLLRADPNRIAIGGLSMGGFGAYDLARLYPGRFCAVGGDSPALWISGGESAAGAFDSAEDFGRHDVIGAAEGSTNPYPGMKLWIDVGSEDPFRAADTRFAGVLKEKGRAVQFHIWPGGHDQSYWQSHWGSYLDFYASALHYCHQS